MLYKNKNLEEIHEKVGKEIERKREDFGLYILSFDENIYPFDTTPKLELFSKIESTCSYNSSFFVVEFSPEEK